MQARDDFFLLELREVSKFRSLHNDRVRLNDTTLLGNGFSCNLVVTSNHANGDSGLLAELHSFRNSLSERILNTDNAKEYCFRENILKNNLLTAIDMVDILGWPRGEVLVADANGSKRPFRVTLNELLDSFDIIFRQMSERSVVGRVAENLCALGEKNFGGTLDIKAGTAVRVLDNNTHTLAAGIERDKLQDLGVLTLLTHGSHAEMVLGKDEQSCLSLGANEGLLAIDLTLESSRVEDNRLEENILDRFAKHLSKFTDANITTCIHGSRGAALVSAL